MNPRTIGRVSVREFLTSRRDRITPEMAGVPAFVQNGRLDVLGTNALARALYHDKDDDAEPANFDRYVFLDERLVTQLSAWDAMAADALELLAA